MLAGDARGGLQRPRLKPRHIQDLGRAKALFVDDPPTKQFRLVPGDVARGQQFHISAERDDLREPMEIVVAGICGRQPDQEVGGWYGVRPDEHPRWNAMVEAQVIPHVEGGGAERRPRDRLCHPPFARRRRIGAEQSLRHDARRVRVLLAVDEPRHGQRQYLELIGGREDLAANGFIIETR